MRTPVPTPPGAEARTEVAEDAGDATLVDDVTDPGVPPDLQTSGPVGTEDPAVARVVALFGEHAEPEADEDPERTQDDEAMRLLLALDRPARPPTAQPKKGRVSDGGDSVAYSGSARPVPRYAAPRERAKVVVERLQRVRDPKVLAELEAPTVCGVRSIRRPWRVLAALLGTATAAFAVGALVAVRTMHRAAPDTAGALAEPSTAVGPRAEGPQAPPAAPVPSLLEPPEPASAMASPEVREKAAPKPAVRTWPLRTRVAAPTPAPADPKRGQVFAEP